MWWGYHHGFGCFPFVFFPFGLLFLLFLCFVVTRIFWFRRVGRFGRGDCHSVYGPRYDDRDLEAILKRRLANGEITETEYNQLKDVLKQ